MTTTPLETFRRIVTLEDGARVLLRPLTPADKENLIALYTAASRDDLLMLLDDVADPDIIEQWAADPDYGHVLPLLALINDRIVGNVTLHRRAGAQQHIGQVRIFLAADARGRGLGTEMLKTIIDLARKEGLMWLQANVFSSQPKVIRAFEGQGFHRQCEFEDYFMLPGGQTEDVVILMLRLLKRSGAF